MKKAPFIKCAICGDLWLTGIKEEEGWVCENCKEERDNYSPDYPLGGMAEPYDIEMEKEL